jgi:L-threonylcarbamoyladenylate synthase
MAATVVSAARKNEALDAASRAISGGGIAAVPTETFYGLCSRYDSEAALERLYALKRRPKGRAVPLIIGGEEMLGLVAADIPQTAHRLAARFWPGPLTLLLDARNDLTELITAGTGKVAVRVPGHSFALDLVRSLGFPLTATSANISGLPPAESAGDVVAYFGDALDVVVEGETPGGMPSTIVRIEEGGVKVTRAGKVPEEEIWAALSV